MSVLFFSQIVPFELQIEVTNSRKRGMPAAAIALQNKIIQGLVDNQEKVELINVLPLSSYPKNSSIKNVRQMEFEYTGGYKGTNIGYLNVSLLRILSIIKGLKKEIRSLDEITDVLIYDTCIFFLIAAIYIRKYNPKCRIVMMIPDLPEFSNLKIRKSIKDRVALYISKKLFELSAKSVDALVLLTEQMKEYLEWEKPYTVVEGIASDVGITPLVEKNDTKTIVYTGTTNERFGVGLLVDAFEKIEDDNTHLIICGYGDYDEVLRERAHTDERIIFKGVVSHDEALQLQSQASILVNPRPNNEDYTKYSFPSKTMEYLSTGVPVVAFKLDGIPEEYSQYIAYVKDNSADSLADKLKELLSWTNDERVAFGKKGREFVINSKNEKIQVEKILQLYSEI